MDSKIVGTFKDSFNFGFSVLMSAVIAKAANDLIKEKSGALGQFEKAYNKTADGSSCSDKTATGIITRLEKEISILENIRSSPSSFVLNCYDDDKTPEEIWRELNSEIKKVMDKLVERIF
jgi:hypothetical protein